MSSARKLPQSSTAVDVGCSCGRPKKLSHLFLFPKLSKPFSSNKNQFNSTLPKPDPYTSSSSDPSFLSQSTTPSLFESEEMILHSGGSSSSGGVGKHSRIGDSVAVVKDSSDPYLDFRHSMLQMILEKEIYSKDELRELLDCFLALNSPYHHDVIVRAFSEIWNGVFSMGGGFSAVSSRVRRRSRDF